ncbi:unnamed protein product [Spirodela intermedia]|uniref:DYW domain-containing protein n=1 Tax=Spirodela intermedia TaxID=51605 RepID=A0A7I8J400_SPIIN|nr:unnamed protein product [Spirodela intermedia]CAA6664957.1 unnamed protein product [Spirodela intermedia]
MELPNLRPHSQRPPLRSSGLLPPARDRDLRAPRCLHLPAALKACEQPADARRLHAWILKLGFQWDLFVSASLVHAYSRSCLMADARKVFDDMPVRDLASWNAMISGFCQNGNAAEALSVFEEMVKRGVGVDPVTITSVLPVCPPLGNLPVGLSIHSHVVKRGLDGDVFVSNALVNMYQRPGFVEFHDICYEQGGDSNTAFEFYHRMKVSGIEPDALTLVSIASAASQIGDDQNGRSVHAFLLRRGLDSARILVGNAVVDMYAKLNDMASARRVFDGLRTRDVISWNTLITGYAQNGSAREAIDAFHALQEQEVITPSQGTLVAVLPAYAHVGSLQQGMRIHGLSIHIGLKSDVFVSTCLIDMYAKCGRLGDAVLLFREAPRRSSIPWNAIIAGHGIHGHGEQAAKLFREMEEEGVKPDKVTFISLLAACSHAGLVDQGRSFFQSMHSKYGIEPTRKHYACLVDLLSRAGDLDAAHDCIRSMPMKPDASVWGALLGACRIYGILSEIDPENVGYYVLLSNMYAKVRKWQGVDEVRSLVKNRGLKKTPGWTSMEVGTEVHVFFTGSFSHPRSDEIYKELRALQERMKTLGYVPDHSFVLQDVEEDEKEHILQSHSERLAIAFGIINLPPGTPISIFKNLRVCGDCHSATKFISRLTEREIIVRDSNRFHHFKDGLCSCGDYW